MRKLNGTPHVITYRDAEPHEVPRLARTLALRAEQHGWRVRTTFALAIVGEGDDAQRIESIGVRMISSWGVLIGVWVGARFDSGLGRAYGADTLSHKYTLAELRTLIAQAAS